MYSVTILRFSGNPCFNRILKPLLKQRIFFPTMLKKAGGGCFSMTMSKLFRKNYDFKMSESLLLERPVGLVYASFQVSTFKSMMTRMWHINQ